MLTSVPCCILRAALSIFLLPLGPRLLMRFAHEPAFDDQSCGLGCGTELAAGTEPEASVMYIPAFAICSRQDVCRVPAGVHAVDRVNCVL